MTWAQFIADGSGQLQFRLVIEGAPDQWVTHRSLAGSVGDGRTRRYGLVPSQIEINERAILQEAELELSGMTLTIAEGEDNAATYAFARTPRTLAWLAEDVGVTDPETFDVDGTSKITTNGYVHAGTETWQVTAKTSSTITIARAKWQTQLQKHFVEVGAESKSVAITDAPGAFRGRRAFLYAHGPTELSPTAAGTLIWRGVVAQQPVLENLVRWKIQLDPITVLLDQELAADTDRPTGISGVYYPWSMPFIFRIIETDGLGVANQTDDIFVHGYYQTAQDFCDALNNALPSMGSWTNDYVWVKDEEGHPRLSITAGAAPDNNTFVIGGSRIDGIFDQFSRMMDSQGIAITNPADVVPGDTYTISSKSDGDRVRKGFPRAWYGVWVDINVDRPQYNNPTVVADWPVERVYLADTLGATAADAVSINLYLGTEDKRDRLMELSAVGQTDTENDILTDPTYAFGDARGEALDTSTEIRLTRKYTANFDLVQFRNDVLDEAINKNKGSTPWITDEDVDDWAAAEEAAEELGAFATSRDYFFSRPVTLKDAWKEEAKLLGGYFFTQSSGKIKFGRLRAPPQTETSALEIDEDMILAGEWPHWATEKGGIVNQVTVRTGYDVVEDKHVGDVFHVRNVQSISEHSRTQALEIAPYSSERYPLELDDARRIAQTPLGFFNKFHILEVDVTWKAWNARLGDTVSVTHRNLPDPLTGTRGLVAARATVIGRRWTIPGFGRLTLLLHAKRVGGYAPSAKVVSSTHLGSNIHRVTCVQTFYSPTGVNDLSFFQAGDFVETYQLDHGSPATRTGTVVGTPTATTIDVDSGSSSAFSSANWVLHFRDRADTYTPSDNAAQYVWIADADHNLYSGDDAFQYAP